MESTDPGIRWGWLKIMYIYTVLSAGLLGLGVVLAPDYVISIMGWPLQDPVIFGVFGSVYVAFGLVAILGLRSPLKFSPAAFTAFLSDNLVCRGCPASSSKRAVSGLWICVRCDISELYHRRPDSHTLRLYIWKKIR